MLSFLNIRCPTCESLYTLSVEELNVLLLFRCQECGQYNMYVTGRVLMLDKDVMDNGTEREKRRHIIEIIQLNAREVAGNVLKNIDKILDVNVGIDLLEQDPATCVERESERMGEVLQSGVRPSIRRVDAPLISVGEVRDFVNIDLNLIDKRRHFDRYFGGNNN
ncbi:MAG: hypothetical protein JSV16_00420 [Candidatus Hydrogenedentota bacterium]|nr:MAG: hypothetical protein JSV16_00420 [Candidatus Hydrogenedentota bacterium]